MLNKKNLEKLLTLACRLLGLGSRFLLTFLITKEISLEFQGEYTLVTTTVALLIIFFGFDFYVYSNRLIIKGNEHKIFYFKNSLIFYSFSYALLLPIIWTIYNYVTFIDLGSFWVLYFLIIFEHLGQEFFRTYISLRNPLFANILLFIRTGIWAGIIVVNLVFNQGFTISIAEILQLWLCFAFLTSVLGICFFPGISGFFSTQVDFSWIKKGIGVGLTMFLSTICLKIIEYSDRYLITYFLGKVDLGVYALYFQLANLINVMVFTMYISFVYPDIIQAVHEKDVKGINKGMKTIKNKTFLLIGIYAICSIVFIPFFLNYIGKDELYSNVPIFYILLTGCLLLNLSFSYHYLIVGYEKEKQILKATLLACVFNVAANIILIPLFGIYGAAISLLVGNICLYIFKRKYSNKIIAQWK